MKILHIATGFPLSFQGGITNYVRTLALTQSEAGNEVHILCNNDSFPEPNLKYHYFESKFKPFSFVKIKDKQNLKKIYNILKKEQFDIIHVHMILQVDFQLYEVMKEFNYIVSLHDYYYLCPRIEMISKKGELCRYRDNNRCETCISYLECSRFLNKCNNVFKKVTKKSLPIIRQKVTTQRFENFKIFLENAKYLLPVSNRVQEIYLNSGIKAKYAVLHIGNISADNFNEEYYYNITPHKIKLLFLGRLSYNKGVEILFNIADRINDENVEIHFYGNSGEYELALKKHGIIDHGKYIQSDLPDILKEFDMGMVLSVWEDNGPQVVMELLNNHLPVIGTKMGGIPDFVTMKNGYIFDPYSKFEFEQLIEFINTLTPEKISFLKKNIKRTTTTEEHYYEIMNIYEKAL